MIEAVPVAVSRVGSCLCQSQAVSAGCWRAAPRGAHPGLSLINSRPCPCKAIGLAQHELLALSRQAGRTKRASPYGWFAIWWRFNVELTDFLLCETSRAFFLGPCSCNVSPATWPRARRRLKQIAEGGKVVFNPVQTD